LFSLISNIFGYVLKFCLDICGNYGLAVILFSVIIKAIIFPLTLKQQKSLKKNQELQPKIQELQNKYKNDQEKLNIEYQKFMKENKFNPFGGCLLMIFQLIVLIGVLYIVSNPMTYMEKADQKTIDTKLQAALIKQDFSGDIDKFEAEAHSYVMKNSGEKYVKEIIEKNKVSGDVNIYIEAYKKTNRYYELKVLKEEYDLHLFGVDLGDITAQNPSNLRLWVFPILTTIFYYLSLWMVSRKQKKQKVKDANGNEVEMSNMMAMNIMMPLMSGWISYSVPQGMGLYWFINSFLQIIIQLITDKIIDKDKTTTIVNNNGKKEVILEPIEAIKEDEEKKDKNPIKGPNPNKSKKKKKKK